MWPDGTMDIDTGGGRAWTEAKGTASFRITEPFTRRERTLLRRLKNLGQESSKTFIRRVQLESARTLLETDSAAVKAVAQHCGWRDEGSFRRAFVRHTGMTPTTYRAWARQRRGGSDL